MVPLYYDVLCAFMVSSAVKAHQFFTEESWDTFKQIFDTYMLEASKVLIIFIYLFIYFFALDLKRQTLVGKKIIHFLK